MKKAERRRKLLVKMKKQKNQYSYYVKLANNLCCKILGLSIGVNELLSYAWEMIERRFKGTGRNVMPELKK
jgi:hypothetical protein